jgi:hypothetical protein
MSTTKIFSLEGKGLKLTTAADIEPHIKALQENNEVEEVRLLGNTLGVEASEALAKVLETKKTLKVCLLLSAPPSSMCPRLTHTTRSPTSPTSSQPVCCLRSPLRSPTS